MLPEGITRASFTQWELFFARHYGKRLSLYIAEDNYVPDKPAATTEDDADAQQAVRRYIHEYGLDYVPFSNIERLCRAILKEDWPVHRPLRPAKLPYPTMRDLFKGRDEVLQQLTSRLMHRHGAPIVRRPDRHPLPR